MSNSLPYMPWYIGDFLRSTAGWTLAERGVYLMLLAAQWEQQALPQDKKRLAAIAGISLPELEEVWPTVGPKFQEKNGTLSNVRLEEHRQQYLDHRQRLAENGRKGGRKRWGKARQDAPDDSGQANAPYMRPEFHEQVVAAYNELCAALPPIKNWPEHRAKALNDLIAATLDSPKPADTLERWRWFFEGVARTPFLTGGADSGWRADIDWLLMPEHYFKIVEGGYDSNQKPSRHLPVVKPKGYIDGL